MRDNEADWPGPTRRDPPRRDPVRRDPVRRDPVRRDGVRRDGVRRDAVPSAGSWREDDPNEDDHDTAAAARPCDALPAPAVAPSPAAVLPRGAAVSPVFRERSRARPETGAAAGHLRESGPTSVGGAPDGASPSEPGAPHRERPEGRSTASPTPAHGGASPPREADASGGGRPAQADGDPSPYLVGYKRPPAATRFQPGVSGNPKGRPKASKNVRTLAKEALEAPMKVTLDGKPKTITRMAAIVQRLMKQALEKGDLKAIGFLLQLADEMPGGAARGGRGGGSAAPAGEEEAGTPPLSAVERDILASIQREVLLDQGLAPDVVEAALRAIGLTGDEGGA